MNKDQSASEPNTRKRGPHTMNLLAHLTPVESPMLVVAYVLGIATGMLVSLIVYRLRTR